MQVQEGPGRVTCFHRVRQSLGRLRADRTGATAIEYALIAALIALAIFSSVDVVGQQNSALIQRAADSFDRD
ncbi:Flp family type IVb pilin [Croceibacterium ferulae]|uniref:Flp family type IVb pilin n=1 Tax=Croceibacterium ferulae TaxID=1854641 RepID=UPI00240E4D67|nr:Flp family type IVb pilin [Croceibacterium ferulae]